MESVRDFTLCPQMTAKESGGMKKSVKYLKIFCNLVVAALVIFCVIFVLPRVLAYFMPFVVGLVLSLIANPVIKFLEKWIKIKRKYGFVMMIILVIGGIVLICDAVGSALWEGIQSFMEYLPTMYSNAGTELMEAGAGLEKLFSRIPILADLDFAKLEEMIQNFLNELMSGSGETTIVFLENAAKGIPNIFVSSIVGLLATYFFIVDREKLLKMLRQHIPESVREKSGTMYRQVLGVVGGYFKAQFKIMGVIYVILLIGLVMLDVDYAWLIAFGIALLDMLPVFGTGTVLCPWAVVKLFSGSYMTALGMLILYAVTLIVHQLIQPKLVGDSVGMDPFAALFFMYIGYRVSGVAGMVFAIPIGMILINVYRAGAFDTLIWCIREVVKDFNEFRRLRP